MKPGGPQLPAVLVNGETTDCLSSSDRGLLYGDGVFETVAVERGRPRFCKAWDSPWTSTSVVSSRYHCR